MGIFKSVGDFLFGKEADIFDQKGRVVHKFTEDKWKQWDARFKANPDFDWKNHGAVERVTKPSKDKKNG